MGWITGFYGNDSTRLFSVAGPRYWEPFDIDVTGLAEVAIHERIRDRFAHYGLNLTMPTIQNGQQVIVGGRTYYFVNVPWSPLNRAAKSLSADTGV